MKALWIGLPNPHVISVAALSKDTTLTSFTNFSRAAFVSISLDQSVRRKSYVERHCMQTKDDLVSTQ